MPHSPSVVKHLLDLDPALVHPKDDEPCLLWVLAEKAQQYACETQTQGSRSNIRQCLELYLHAEPDPTVDFFAALQSLPEWLSQHAVAMPFVQIKLNQRICEPFPTAVVMLDLYLLAMIIVLYVINVIEAVKHRFGPNPDEINRFGFTQLYVCVRDFLCRRTAFSNNMHLRLLNPTNWINVAFVSLVLYWTTTMQCGGQEGFRTVTALVAIILWLKSSLHVEHLVWYCSASQWCALGGEGSGW